MLGALCSPGRIEGPGLKKSNVTWRVFAEWFFYLPGPDGYLLRQPAVTFSKGSFAKLRVYTRGRDKGATSHTNRLVTLPG